MTNKTTNWLYAAAAVASAAAIIALANPGPGVAFAVPILAPATAVVTALLITTLFVERSMAVLNALIFGDAQRRAELQLLGVTPPGANQTPAEAVAAVLGSKERLRLLLSFVAGLFVSAAGVRTLQGLLQGTPTLHPWFNTVDVILTAGLIAGGSNGLAFLLQILKDWAANSGGNGTPDRNSRQFITIAEDPNDTNGLPRVTHAQLRARLVTTS